MPSSYDISTVVSRSYISEHLQDQIQKGPENNNAVLLSHFQKESEEKISKVSKAEGSHGVSAVKKENKKDDKNNTDNHNNRRKIGVDKIDIQA